jgi:hypothetical protein
MTFSESSSAFLLVCKSWLRVATPLLYNVAILRSKAQAQALAATLNANPALGRFIKKLRVEGGYAISMHKILQASKNITDIFLSMRIPPSDNACGLCRGLPLINPVRLILDWTTLGRPARKLFDTLEQCIPAWKKMVPLLSSFTHPLMPLFRLSSSSDMDTRLTFSINLSRPLISRHWWFGTRAPSLCTRYSYSYIDCGEFTYLHRDRCLHLCVLPPQIRP